MARINGVEPRQAGWFVRFVYWMVRRKLGRVVLPEPMWKVRHSRSCPENYSFLADKRTTLLKLSWGREKRKTLQLPIWVELIVPRPRIFLDTEL